MSQNTSYCVVMVQFNRRYKDARKSFIKFKIITETTHNTVSEQRKTLTIIQETKIMYFNQHATHPRKVVQLRGNKLNAVLLNISMNRKQIVSVHRKLIIK